jgi:hypothetical protein
MEKDKVYVGIKDFYYKVPRRFYKKLKGMRYNKNLEGVTFNNIFKWLSKNYCFTISVTERTRDVKEEKIFSAGVYIKPKGFSLSVSFPNVNIGTGFGYKSLYKLCCSILKETIAHCDIKNHKKIAYYFVEIEPIKNPKPIRIKEHQSYDKQVYVLDTLYHCLTTGQILSGKSIVVFDTDQKRDRYFKLLKHEIIYSFDFNYFSKDFVLVDKETPSKEVAVISVV